MVSLQACLLHLALVAGLTQAAPDTLRLINLVYRHGDRSAISSFPTNPNKPEDVWPDGLGWLTPEGMKMQYSLGSFLRRRYNGFLSPAYNNTEIRVESSDVERCLMSAYSNLAGLFPPRGGQMWNHNIPWQPIPVHTRPRSEDRMLGMGAPCPRFDQMFEESKESERIRREEAKNRDFYKFISKMTGTPHEDVEHIWKVADNFYCEQQHNISWTPWMNASVFEQLRELEALGYVLQFGGEKSRFKGGPLVKEWVDRAQSKVMDNSLPIKMNMFSAHDSTVVAVLSALELHNNLNPPYTATVLMELHQDTAGQHYVQLYYRNHTSMDPNDDTQPHPLVLPGCEFRCPFHEFVELTERAYPEDWEAECSLPTSTSTSTTPTTSPFPTVIHSVNTSDFRTPFIITVGVYSTVLLLLVVVVMVTCFKHRSKSPENYNYKP